MLVEGSTDLFVLARRGSSSSSIYLNTNSETAQQCCATYVCRRVLPPWRSFSFAAWSRSAIATCVRGEHRSLVLPVYRLYVLNKLAVSLHLTQQFSPSHSTIQVHEKSLLLPLCPLAFLWGDAPLFTTWVQVWSAVQGRTCDWHDK